MMNMMTGCITVHFGCVLTTREGGPWRLRYALGTSIGIINNCLNTIINRVQTQSQLCKAQG